MEELSKPAVKEQILSETTGYTGRFNYDVAHAFHKIPITRQPRL